MENQQWATTNEIRWRSGLGIGRPGHPHHPSRHPWVRTASQVPVPGLLNVGAKLLVWLYRRLGGLWSGPEFSTVLLTTRGAKTGRVRTSPLGGFTDGEGAWLVVGSLGGAAHHPAWLFNMAKHPHDIWLEVGRKRIKVRAETVEGPERAEALGRIAAIAPRYCQLSEEDRSRNTDRAADPRTMTIRVTPRGTRGAGFPLPLMKIFKLFGGQQIRMFRRDGGQSMSSRMGFPVVLLTTRGSKTGQMRTTALGGFPDGENSWLVVASLGGAAHHPAWFLNMAKHPDDIWLEVGKELFKVHAESLEDSARTEALARIAAIAARYGGYQEKTDREIPIVRLTRLLS